MIIGECNRDNDLAVNVVKGKQLTNMRAVVLKRLSPITLEYALDYINSDELVEVTPNFIRLRKRILNTEERKKADAKKINRLYYRLFIFLLYIRHLLNVPLSFHYLLHHLFYYLFPFHLQRIGQ